jgi:predicted ArsR family transcriptional regulator
VHDPIREVAALEQPLRRELHRLLVEDGGWVGRDAAAEALGVPRSVAAFHLDKLAEADVVEVTYERTSGRSGPGAGRPSKLYRRREGEVSASVPPRRYDLAGALLADAVAMAAADDVPVGECVGVVARAAGRRLAAGATLDDLGYEPREADGEVVLVNCPFHRLAEEHRELICGMNLEFLHGLLEDDPAEPVLAPEPGVCCVRLRRG